MSSSFHLKYQDPRYAQDDSFVSFVFFVPHLHCTKRSAVQVWW